MKDKILKIANVPTEEEFYKQYPTEESFIKEHGENEEFQKVLASRQHPSEADPYRYEDHPNMIITDTDYSPLYNPQDHYEDNPFTGGGENTKEPRKQQPEQEKISSIFDWIKDEEPKEDLELQNRVRKAGLMSAIGDTLGNLAGAVGNQAGGRVPLLPDNQNIYKLYSILDREKNKYQALHRDWQGRALQAKIADLNNALKSKQLDAENALKLQMQKHKLEMDYANLELRGQDLGRKMQHDKDMVGLGAGRLQVSAIRAQQAQDKANKPYFEFNNPVTGQVEVYPRQKDFHDLVTAMVNDTSDPENTNVKEILYSKTGLPLSNDALKAVVANWRSRVVRREAAQQQEQAMRESARVAQGNLDKTIEKTVKNALTPKTDPYRGPWRAEGTEETVRPVKENKQDKWIKEYGR